MERVIYPRKLELFKEYGLAAIPFSRYHSSSTRRYSGFGVQINLHRQEVLGKIRKDPQEEVIGLYRAQLEPSVRDAVFRLFFEKGVSTNV